MFTIVFFGFIAAAALYFVWPKLSGWFGPTNPVATGLNKLEADEKAAVSAFKADLQKSGTAASPPAPQPTSKA